MAKTWASLMIVLLSFIMTEVIIVCVFQNYVSFLTNCKAPSQIQLQLSRDSLNITHSLTVRPQKSQITDHSDEDQIMKFSKEDPSFQLQDAVSMESELQYTVTFQRETPSNYSDLFEMDSKGNCRASSCKWPKMPGATRELVASAPELFEKIPLHYLDNFKNPCWLRGKTELNCLPYFYVIGMYKAGTSDIWAKIKAHPDVINNAPKEPHWWGLRRFGDTYIPCHKKEILQARNLTGGQDDSSFEWYLNFYKSLVVPEVINNSVLTKEGIRYHPKVFGDASITTMYSIGLDWIKSYPFAAEPPYTNADLFRALQPNAKFILMIRNPTERANSYFWYTNNYREPNPNGTDNADKWHNQATQYIQCFQKCIQEHNLRYCAYAADCPFDFIPDMQVSIYHVYIRDWMKVFSRDHFKVLRLEDWQAEPVKVYRDLIKFLELRELSEDEEKAILAKPFRNKNKLKHEPTRQDTWKALNDFYRPYNLELAKLMGDNKFNYPDYYGPDYSSE